MYMNGWIDDHNAVMQAASSLETPYFDDTEAANLPESDLPKNVCLWKCALKVTGHTCLPVRDQGKVGSCTGFGTARAIEYTNLIEICEGDQEQFEFFSRILIYQGSRVVIGNNRFKNQDGSLGVYAAQFCLSYGLLDESSKLIDYSYEWRKCKSMQNDPVPTVILDFIKNHKVNSITNIKDWVSAKKSLAQGYGVAVSARMGFSKKRGKDGICVPEGVWNHCACLSGYMTINGKEYGVYENSWGEYMGMDNPVPEQANNGSFLIESGYVNSMLQSGDCWAFSGVNGFKKKKIDWRF